MARAVLRLSGAGHSAAIHCIDPQTILDFAARVEAYRVVVNAPCSQGAAGFGTDLAPSFHYRHRLLRPLFGRREHRPAASRPLDADRAP